MTWRWQWARSEERSRRKSRPGCVTIPRVQAANWTTLAEIKRNIGTTSILQDGRAVFNVAGNKYRIVMWINYPYRVAYVRFIGTHRQYDRIDAQTI